jgi:hypothetical protein
MEDNMGAAPPPLPLLVAATPDNSPARAACISMKEAMIEDILIVI